MTEKIIIEQTWAEVVKACKECLEGRNSKVKRGGKRLAQRSYILATINLEVEQ